MFARKAEIQREVLHRDEQWRLLKIMLVTQFCIVLLFFKKKFQYIQFDDVLEICANIHTLL